MANTLNNIRLFWINFNEFLQKDITHDTFNLILRKFIVFSNNLKE